MGQSSPNWAIKAKALLHCSSSDTTEANVLLARLVAAGISLRVVGDKVKVSAPIDPGDGMLDEIRTAKPVLLDLLTAGKGSIDHEAIPTEWKDGLARLAEASPPSRVYPEDWRDLVARVTSFAWSWGAAAAILDWTTHECFGSPPGSPFGRSDLTGLALSTFSGDIAAITAREAFIRRPRGGVLRWRRGPRMVGSVPVWE